MDGFIHFIGYPTHSLTHLIIRSSASAPASLRNSSHRPLHISPYYPYFCRPNLEAAPENAWIFSTSRTFFNHTAVTYPFVPIACPRANSLPR
jgi:hypothetical protein